MFIYCCFKHIFCSKQYFYCKFYIYIYIYITFYTTLFCSPEEGGHQGSKTRWNLGGIREGGTVAET